MTYPNWRPRAMVPNWAWTRTIPQSLHTILPPTALSVLLAIPPATVENRPLRSSGRLGPWLLLGLTAGRRKRSAGMTSTTLQNDGPPPASAATSNGPSAPPPRPWYRLHRRTIAILIPGIAWMFLINVPGEKTPSHSQVHHGWPFIYFSHPPHGPSYWSFAGLRSPQDLDWLAIALNGLIAVGIAGLVAAACEYWIRRYGRLFRFGLSSLLVVTALIATLLGLALRDLQRCSLQERILNGLSARAGVSVHREPRSLDWLRSLLGHQQPSRVVGLIIISKDGAPLETPAVGSLSDLRWLRLDNLSLSGEWVDQIARLRLENLQIELSDIQGNRLEVLRALASVPNLKSLFLRGDTFEDADLAPLASANDLIHFGVVSKRVTGRSLEHLARLEGVRSLEFEDADFTAANFEPLAAIKNLDSAVFAGCKMSSEDEARLKNSLGPLSNWSVRQESKGLKRSIQVHLDSRQETHP